MPTTRLKASTGALALRSILLGTIFCVSLAGAQGPPTPATAPPSATAEAPEAATTVATTQTASLEVEDDPLLDEIQNEQAERSLPRWEQWLVEVEPLITGIERRLFESLSEDYQREAFIQEFWKVRDPYPETPRNELKERWPQRVAQAKSLYGGLADDRSRILLVHGPPSGGFKVTCTQKRIPAEVWVYQRTDFLDFDSLVIFIQRDPQQEARIWNPSVNRFALDQVLNRSRNCINGRRLLQAVGLVNQDIENYEQRLLQMLRKPRPRSEEWVHTFVAHSTQVDANAVPMRASTEFLFLGRHQHRTVVQGMIAVSLGEVAVGEFANYRSHDLLLTGEVLKNDALFESFRYKFGFPEMAAPGQIPLAFQRYLRPGDYEIVLKLEDLNAERVYRDSFSLTVPQVDDEYELPTFQDPRTEELFAEATAAIRAGDTGIRLIPPQGDLHTGFTRFDTLVSGDLIEKVRFYLDDQLVLTKNRPPFTVQIDLGSFPDLRTLRVEALDGAGTEVASDELLINSGGYRFAVNLVEPAKGRTYRSSLQARAEVELPSGRSLDRVEFYLNEKLVATLYQEPWVQPIVLPEDEAIAYVRTVAYLPDGNSTEDLVFINAPDYLEELEIQFVELYTTVLDPQGRPVDGLTQENFSVLEDEVPQSIARFERVQDLPIHVGILIDNSASMVGTLGEVRKAALSFFSQAISPRDRAAVITFNSFPHLAVELTNDRRALGSGLAGLTPEGQTALYDSVMFGLYYFTGIKGQRALLVLSDGKDESSRFEFAETLEYARRAGITIYSIGFRLNDFSARAKLTALADETGGRSFYIRNIEELGEIYGQIQRELRSQYLIAYQSSNTEDDGAFRSVDLRIDRSDVEVKTVSGYYP